MYLMLVSAVSSLGPHLTITLFVEGGIFTVSLRSLAFSSGIFRFSGCTADSPLKSVSSNVRICQPGAMTAVVFVPIAPLTA